ncbi:ABC transporter permease [Allostreptomyces psammosilenae]|uniref:ABC transporter permease n=1 Tax=Allostreptomyces psammosilenae TaxID=1892865 RepID=A0A852ZXH2_9ACTN|nr:ABC transporter permease [Allostreptomyces psammosilenae]NYI06447.1 hypothetical protein [Allostreptomyces psammosilenae]
MTDVLASEWLKIRSLQSSQAILGVVIASVLMMPALTWYNVSVWDGLPPERQAQFDGSSPVEALAMLLQITVAVFGVLTVTSEYGSGMIRTSVVAVPRRRTLLGAKAVVVAVSTTVAGQLSVFVVYFVCRWIVGDRPHEWAERPVAEALPHLLASGLMLTVVGLVALGLGTLLRSTAGGVGAVVALLVVVPGLANVFSEPWNERVASVMLSRLAGQLAGEEGAGVLSPLGALAVLLGYLLLVLGGALHRFARRDV